MAELEEACSFLLIRCMILSYHIAQRTARKGGLSLEGFVTVGIW